MSTVTHVTHEALQKVGGIGAVLDGLLGARAYREAVARTFLVGPGRGLADERKLAEVGEVLYATRTGSGSAAIRARLEPVAQKFDVNLVYGRRKLTGGSEPSEAEVLLVDATHLNRRTFENFRQTLQDRFGLESDRFDDVEDYLLYLKMAEPAVEAVRALLGRTRGPHYLLAHEYMGMPAALKACLGGSPRFSTVFYAHEVATVRPVVENSPGHDTMFYNVLRRCRESGRHFADAFGDPSGYYRHALISQAKHCDAIFAVSSLVREELLFLDPAFVGERIRVVHNGVVAREITPDARRSARERLLVYAERLLGSRPDRVFTHVTRPVVSKGIWRDLRVLEHLDGILHADNQRGVLFLLTSALPPREPADTVRMEADYGWPVAHRPGAPDLVGGEIGIWADAHAFNRTARAIRVVLVNQFGWDAEQCGRSMPEGSTFQDLRSGTDAEFGQSIYEPFGIAQLEPLGYGAVCVVSSACGCTDVLGATESVQRRGNAIVADYVSVGPGRGLEDLLSIGREERDRIERERSRQVARDLAERLPKTADDHDAMLLTGRRAVEGITWDRICEEHFLPGLAFASGSAG